MKKTKLSPDLEKLIMDLRRPVTPQQIMQRYVNQALTLPREKRQEYIDLIHAGKTIGEACQLAGVTFDESMGIMKLNIENHSYLQLRKEAR